MRKVSGARPYLHLIFFFLSTIFSSFLVFFLFSSLCRMEPVTFMRAVLLAASPGPTAAYLRPEGGRGIPRGGGGQRRLSPPPLLSHRFVPDARAGVAQFAPPVSVCIGPRGYKGVWGGWAGLRGYWGDGGV